MERKNTSGTLFFVFAGICLLCRLLVFADALLSPMLSGYPISYGLSTAGNALFETVAFLCLIFAFVCGFAGKRRAAVTLAVICIIDAALRSILIPFLQTLQNVVVYGEAMTYSDLFSLVLHLLLRPVSLVPDILLLIFFRSENKRRTPWLICGIVLTSALICGDYSASLMILYRSMSIGQILAVSNAARLILGIPHGLVYLFGFMGCLNRNR